MDRDLGYWETIKVLMHDLFAGNDLVVVALRLQGNIEVDLLKKALNLGFQRHPLLRATIRPKADGYCFKVGIDFMQVPILILQQTHPDQPLEILEKEIKTPFLVDQYLWRVTLLKAKESCHLMLSFHHAICDGTAIFTFIHELLSYYDMLEHKLEPKFKVLELLKPQENFLLEKINWSNYLKQVIKYQAIKRKGWQFDTPAPLQQRVPKLIIKKISIELINNLEKLCKKNKVSLNSLFNALTLITKYNLDGYPYNGTLCTWVNTRDICYPAIEPHNFGYFVNYIATKHHITKNTNIWDLARDYHSQLKSRLPELGGFPGKFNLNQAKKNYNMKFLEKTDHFLYDFTLSYLSKIPLATHYGSLTLADLSIGVNIVSGFAAMVLEIFNFQTEVAFACCYVEPLINRAWVAEYMSKFQDILISLEF
ncbi:condensation domain-containing protein [Legionella gresilensis]|uniref:condensation domain-containing protein n=1 Tax=Legionella gresilensis TaxID=91823 RepID=UPI0010415321|nr:condensation domain-containing protein [Legionella gresilensis]